jgi:hypothetical protein
VDDHFPADAKSIIADSAVVFLKAIADLALAVSDFRAGGRLLKAILALSISPPDSRPSARKHSASSLLRDSLQVSVLSMLIFARPSMAWRTSMYVTPPG